MIQLQVILQQQASEYKNNNNKQNNNKTSDRTSLVLGQMGRGRATRSRKREKLVQDLFTFIIGSEIITSISNMSTDTLYAMDMIVDGIEHPHIRKLVSKIEIKFYKCDEHSRGSLGLEEFNRFLMKCGAMMYRCMFFYITFYLKLYLTHITSTKYTDK